MKINGKQIMTLARLARLISISISSRSTATVGNHRSSRSPIGSSGKFRAVARANAESISAEPSLRPC